MLFSLGHGHHARAGADAAPTPATCPVSAVVQTAAYAHKVLAEAGDVPAPQMQTVPKEGKFRYYFPKAAGLAEVAGMPDLLDALADSMAEANPVDAAENAKIAPVFTYLGQFIDHDVTANTDRETELSIIEGPIGPLDRDVVANGLANLRDGSLRLDSLYGDGTGQGAFAMKLAALMRSPGDASKMRLAIPAAVGDRVPIPADDATDLLRLGFLLRNGLVTKAELEALEPEGLRDQFIDKATGEPIVSRAILGDARNDENLVVAQLQVLFLRLHNKFAEATQSTSFRLAQKLTQWHYQRLVVNSFLPTVCDPAIVAEVVEMEAPLYAGFFEAHGEIGPKMPMPVEFSVAAFRFGHSMIRNGYDYNRFFGEAVAGFTNVQPFTGFDNLFGFTGSGNMRGVSPNGQIPRNWVIEWDRWITLDSSRPNRTARKIDTNIAPAMLDLDNAPPGVFKHLARRNLRRGYRLNLPTGQACADAVEAAGYKPFARLTPEELRSGSDARRAAVEAGGFDVATPLWFYILKEAEVLGRGEHLGPLGSHIVANTLVGLIIADPSSYWNNDGSRWSPSLHDPANPIDSLAAVVKFCGMA